MRYIKVKPEYGWRFTDMDELLVSVDSAAEALGLRRSMLYELLAKGQLRSVKVGSRRLIPAEALREFVASLEAGQETYEVGVAKGTP